MIRVDFRPHLRLHNMLQHNKNCMAIITHKFYWPTRLLNSTAYTIVQQLAWVEKKSTAFSRLLFICQNLLSSSIILSPPFTFSCASSFFDKMEASTTGSTTFARRRQIGHRYSALLRSNRPFPVESAIMRIRFRLTVGSIKLCAQSTQHMGVAWKNTQNTLWNPCHTGKKNYHLFNICNFKKNCNPGSAYDMRSSIHLTQKIQSLNFIHFTYIERYFEKIPILNRNKPTRIGLQEILTSISRVMTTTKSLEMLLKAIKMDLKIVLPLD